ncbi:uncharacterized protein LOC121592267 [Anopheles merus]|uniref:uncharacterized protein LOC121592267 n=1 Tax=Anopheles merus TaxID=30066 RepID=UPI001BE4208F|nr:uncharacterized protein LOC121592267 [Anopheles merus]
MSLETLMKRFFTIEDLSEKPSWSVEEAACERFYTETTTRDESGKYIVKLPRKPDMIGRMGESRMIALRRFLAIERRLEREPETRKAYTEFMDEYLHLGHMSKVVSDRTTAECYYLPHHPVFKADSTTTKCRVVFDASSKTSTGVSLNDTMMVGPTLQQDGASILLRFRTHQVALTADVAKMYRQVWVHPDDRKLQRILWRSSPSDPIEEFELNTVTYGTAAAPFLAVRTLQQTREDHKEEFPIAASREHDFYVDDFVSGDKSIEEARELQFQMNLLYAKGGFSLHAFIAALRRFVARRGLPAELHSDNGTNFKGASNQLNSLYKLFRSDDYQTAVQSWTLEKGITWKFIPPRAPHFGGLWEAAVRSTKHHLLRVLGSSSLSFEDMATLLANIECCLNSRPITPLTDDPSDVSALTPGHFLVGAPLLQIPDIDTTQLPANRLTHWGHVQQLSRRFWDSVQIA